MASFSSRVAATVGRLVPSRCAGISMAVICLTGVALADDSSIQQVDLLMYHDPKLPEIPTELFVSPEPIPLWMKALSRSDEQLQRVTVDTIALAHRRGMKGLEVAIPKLLELLDQSDGSSDVLRAATAALIELDARDQAERLVAFSGQQDASIAAVVEPALARWKSPVMVDTWADRLRREVDPSAAKVPLPGNSRASLIHAIEGVAALRHAQSADDLRQLVLGERFSPAIRLSAARALGEILTSGLSDQAAGLASQSDTDPLPGLLAVALLKRHREPPAIAALQSLAAHESTTVQAGALARMFDIDPDLVMEFVERTIGSRDVNVRRIVARTLADQKSAPQIAPLSTLLDDVNPGLRREVAASLIQLAQQEELRTEVIRQASLVLDGNAWRGCEQAVIVLVNLDHRPAGKRMVELMNHPRDEVMATSAWGLRRLAMEEHLPAMLDQAKMVYQAFRAGRFDWSNRGAEHQVAQLFMAFGQMRYHEADELLRVYLPKNHELGEDSRPAAAWAIGLLYEGKAPDDLTKLLVQRLNDINVDNAESESFRHTAATALGRMKSESALGDLRKYGNPNAGSVGLGCLWAIEQITGEKSPLPERHQFTYSDWFLAPVK